MMQQYFERAKDLILPGVMPSGCFQHTDYSFDNDGHQVPQEKVTKAGEIFEEILKEVLQPLAFTWYLPFVSMDPL